MNLWLLFLVLLVALLFLALWFLKAPSSRVQIRGRHILITGGSSGIGLELAKLAAAQGAQKVTLVARNKDRLAEAKKLIVDSLSRDSSTEVQIVSADVVDFSSLEKAIAESGPVDVLVCSHGVSIPCAFEDASLEDINTVVDINYKGTMNVIKAALPGMLKDNGAYPRSIAIFSSQAGQAGIFGYASYAGTKAALVNFAQALQHELFVRKIQLSVIYPPDTDTPGLRSENEFKPEITKVLSASSSAMEAPDVARISMDGIKAGKFTVACNFDGLLLAIGCAGMSPQTSVGYAVLEIFASPLVRIISLCVQYGWFRTIRQQLIKQKKCS